LKASQDITKGINFPYPVVDALRRFFILSLRKYMHEKRDIASCRRKAFVELVTPKMTSISNNSYLRFNRSYIVIA
jgi:hypothetical protein